MQIKHDSEFRGSHKTGMLSPRRTPEEITEILGIEPERFDPNDPDSDGKVTLEWRFTVDGKPCAIWDYKGARWSTWGDGGTLAALFPDYESGYGRHSLAALDKHGPPTPSPVAPSPPPAAPRYDFTRRRLARKPQDFDTSGLALFSDSPKQKELF